MGRAEVMERLHNCCVVNSNTPSEANAQKNEMRAWTRLIGRAACIKGEEDGGKAMPRNFPGQGVDPIPIKATPIAFKCGREIWAQRMTR